MARREEIDMTRDFQRKKVYDWEWAQPWWTEGNGTAQAPRMTLNSCERLATKALKRYHCRPVRIKDGRGTTYARGGVGVINLPVWARHPSVILHEVAHEIGGQRWKMDKHGPIFVRLFIQLIATYQKQDEKEVIRSARAAGIKVAGRQHVKPRSAKDV
jgi:hypothetical protein